MQMTNTPPINPSALSEGRHPGFLLKIAEEATPDGWVMKEKSPTMYRWYFALWEVPTLIPQQAPELQTGITSTKFSPKGKFQASKAYVWTCQLLGRHIQPGESVNYDLLFPLPCSVKVSREPGKDFIKIIDVEGWPDGAQYLTEPIKQALQAVLANPQPAQQQPPPPVQPPTYAQPAQQASPAPQPGMQSWANQSPQQPAAATPGKSSW